MIINKDGKLFGKVNIIDIGLVILVILIAFGTYWRFYGNGKAQKVIENTKISYVVEIRGAKKLYLDGIKVDDLVGNVQTSKQYGRIKSITSEPYKDFIIDINGEYKEAIVPNLWKIFLTIEADGVEAGDGFYINEKPFKISNNMEYFKTKYMQFGGFITGITKL
jgi:hypothetical protein